MNNFYEFIKKDIDAKKALINTLPTKTKTNKRKLNQTLEEILATYEDYRTNLKNYLIAKSRKYNVEEEKNNIDKIKNKIEELEHLKFLLNPSNTYYEKMGFDSLLFKINNFNTLNFDSLNDIINEYLDKFEQVAISLTSKDFDYTCYVHEYMQAFLDVRHHVTKNYNKVSEVFEQIYWVNPELINHIELNFRKLISQNEKKFENYISTLQKEVMKKYDITSYQMCISKLQDVYNELNLSDVESLYEIVDNAKKGKINVEQFFDDNKAKVQAYNSLISDSVDITIPKEMSKICTSLDKLRLNIMEYQKYLEFNDLFKYFNDEYSKLIPVSNSDKDKKQEKPSKKLLDEINKKETELQKLNKKILSGKSIFDLINDNDTNRLKRESVYIANELYKLYKDYDLMVFNEKVLNVLSNTMSVSDVLNLYYSHDYFKKIALQNIYNLKDYETILSYSENFDLFAMNPTNIIMEGVPIFRETNIAEIIANKYRLNNIKITEDDLSEENLTNLLNKILLILRLNNINNSNISVEELWFIVEVEKIINKESKENITK